MTTVKCGDCRHYFSLPDRMMIMLPESIKRNPNLKIVCSECGSKVLRRYYAPQEKKTTQ